MTPSNDDQAAETTYVSTGHLPSPEQVRALVAQAYEKYRSVTEGENSKVYPALARVPSELFGICVVGTSGKVLLDAGDDRRFVAPGHDCIDERVRPVAGEVVGGETEPLEVAHVVGGVEIEAAGVLTGEPPGLGGIGFEHDRQLRRQQLALAEQLSGAAGVLDRHEVRVGAVGRVAGELQHPRAERGEHDRRRLRRCWGS